MPGCFRMALYLRAASSARSTTSTRLKILMTCSTAEPSSDTGGSPGATRGTGGAGACWQSPALPRRIQLGPQHHSLCLVRPLTAHLEAEPPQVLRPGVLVPGAQ